MNISQRGFTLVELIVVITILAVLWTIAFISLQWFSLKARDSARVSDLATISKSLEFFKTTEWYFPDPTDAFNISYSWSLAWKQWEFWEDTRRISQRISQVPVDPLTKNPYAYSTTNTRQEYELWSITETTLSYSPDIQSEYALWGWLIPETFANNAFFAYVTWNYNKQIVTVRESDTIYVLWVPTIITTEETSITVQDIITNQSFAVNGGKNLAASYAASLPEGQSHSGSISFTPWSISLSAPLVYEGTVSALNSDDEKQVFWENLKTYYASSNISEQTEYSQLVDTVDGTEVLYVNALIQTDRWGLPSEEIKVNTNLVATPNPSEFITVWNFPSNNYTFTFPMKNDLSLKYDFIIDWWDGSPTTEIDELPDSGPSHTYTTAWEYTVTVTGTLEWFENTWAHAGQLIRVESLWKVWWKNLSGAFATNTNLVSVDAKWDTSEVTNMQSMFAWASSLSSIPNFDTSSVTDMTAMFSNTTSLTSVPNFDTSSVTTMNYMFWNSGIESVTFSNTPVLEIMSAMFSGANNLVSVSFPDTPLMNQVWWMFSSPVLTSISMPNLASLESVWWMFWNMTSLENVSFPNVPSLVSAWGMFWSTPNIKNVFLWNANSLQTTGWMFSWGSSIESVTIQSTSDLVSIAGTFNRSAPSLQSVTISDTSSIIDMSSFLEGATVFNQDLSSWDISSVTDCDDFDLWADAWNPAFRPALPGACLQ